VRAGYKEHENKNNADLVPELEVAIDLSTKVMPPKPSEHRFANFTQGEGFRFRGLPWAGRRLGWFPAARRKPRFSSLGRPIGFREGRTFKVKQGQTRKARGTGEEAEPIFQRKAVRSPGDIRGRALELTANRRHLKRNTRSESVEQCSCQTRVDCTCWRSLGSLSMKDRAEPCSSLEAAVHTTTHAGGKGSGARSSRFSSTQES